MSHSHYSVLLLLSIPPRQLITYLAGATTHRFTGAPPFEAALPSESCSPHSCRTHLQVASARFQTAAQKKMASVAAAELRMSTLDTALISRVRACYDIINTGFDVMCALGRFVCAYVNTSKRSAFLMPATVFWQRCPWPRQVRIAIHDANITVFKQGCCSLDAPK